jgi:hypothetical protein
MRTVVYQSFRATDVPAWMSRCMASVRAWATACGFDYRFFGDELFDRVSAADRGRIDDKLVLSDLARLLVSRELLSEGYDRTVWIDADVVVFDPDAWELPTASDYYLCHELWPVAVTSTGIQFERRVNNAISVYSRGTPFLDFYIDACRRIIARAERPHTLELGTRLLTVLQQGFPLPLLPNIGMFSPLILADLAYGTSHLLPTYLHAVDTPLVAANCCASLRDQHHQGIVLTDEVYAAAVERCLETKLRTR